MEGISVGIGKRRNALEGNSPGEIRLPIDDTVLLLLLLLKLLVLVLVRDVSGRRAGAAAAAAAAAFTGAVATARRLEV